VRLDVGDKRSSKSTLVSTIGEEDFMEDLKDLSGDVRLITNVAAYTGPYSTVYRGRLKSNGQLVSTRMIGCRESLSALSLGCGQKDKWFSRCLHENHTKGEMRHRLNVLVFTTLNRKFDAKGWRGVYSGTET
jgi:hypothetical protein